jgi:hypothetical protein
LLSLWVALVAAVATPADNQPVYRTWGPNPLRAIFRRRFPDFQTSYEQHYAAPRAGLYAAPRAGLYAANLDAMGDESPCQSSHSSSSPAAASGGMPHRVVASACSRCR